MPSATSRMPSTYSTSNRLREEFCHLPIGVIWLQVSMTTPPYERIARASAASISAHEASGYYSRRPAYRDFRNRVGYTDRFISGRQRSKPFIRRERYQSLAPPERKEPSRSSPRQPTPPSKTYPRPWGGHRGISSTRHRVGSTPSNWYTGWRKRVVRSSRLPSILRQVGTLKPLSGSSGWINANVLPVMVLPGKIFIAANRCSRVSMSQTCPPPIRQ